MGNARAPTLEPRSLVVRFEIFQEEHSILMDPIVRVRHASVAAHLLDGDEGHLGRRILVELFVVLILLPVLAVLVVIIIFVGILIIFLILFIFVGILIVLVILDLGPLAATTTLPTSGGPVSLLRRWCRLLQVIFQL